jgi:hypothetical protein
MHAHQLVISCSIRVDPQLQVDLACAGRVKVPPSRVSSRSRGGGRQYGGRGCRLSMQGLPSPPRTGAVVQRVHHLCGAIDHVDELADECELRVRGPRRECLGFPAPTGREVLGAYRVG